MGVTMQINRQTDYALRALLFLALQTETCTIDDIAQKFSIAREHLTKIISRLAKLNYVLTTRGKGGGLKLNPETLSVSLAEITKHFEPSFKVIDCETLACPLNDMCRLNQIFVKASTAFVNTLTQYTLNDILPQSLHEKNKIAKQLNLKMAANDE